MDSSLICVSMDTEASISRRHPEVWGMWEETFPFQALTSQVQDGGQSYLREDVHTQSTARAVGECTFLLWVTALPSEVNKGTSAHARL